MTTKFDPARNELRYLQKVLKHISASIWQLPDKTVDTILNVSTGVGAKVGAASAVTGLVGTFGTAGTGTAIAGLSGAAKTSATLAAIGGVAGGGVLAGTLLLTAGAAGAGFYATRALRKYRLKESAAREVTTVEEQRIVDALAVLVPVIAEGSTATTPISKAEIRILSTMAIAPLLGQLQAALQTGKFDDLSVVSRIRLRGHITNLSKSLERLDAYANSP